jgi:hypothetical protein
MTSLDEYVIWSFEHRAWWRPGEMGYTESVFEAGLYTKAQADRIVTKANRYAPRQNEQAVLRATALTSGAPKQRLTRIAPGVYDDGKGGMHLVLPELLVAHGYADTPENRALLERTMRKMLPDTPVEVVD